MKRLGLLSLQYYRLLLLYNIAFSVLWAVIFALPVNAGSFFIAKLLGYLCALGLYDFSSNKSYFYFRNAGYSMWRIFINAAGIDLLVYLVLISILQLCLH